MEVESQIRQFPPFQAAFNLARIITRYSNEANEARETADTANMREEEARLRAEEAMISEGRIRTRNAGMMQIVSFNSYGQLMVFIRSMQDSISDLEDTVISLQTQNKTLNARNGILQADVKALTAKNAHLESQVSELTAKNTHLESEVAQLKQTNVGLNERLERLEQMLLGKSNASEVKKHE